MQTNSSYQQTNPRRLTNSLNLWKDLLIFGSGLTLGTIVYLLNPDYPEPSFRLSGASADWSYTLTSALMIVSLALASLGLLASLIRGLIKSIKSLKRLRILKQRNYLAELDEVSLTSFKRSAIYSQKRPATASCQLIKQSTDYQIYDVKFTYGGGDYRNDVYYGIYQASLSKALPHLVFDSKVAMGRQFNRSYLKAQSLAVDANFDQAFDSYSPQGYQIDSLSFITPEVLEVMLQLTACDIEILDNQLFCYADGTLTAEGLVWFEHKCQELYRHLNNNISSYRDVRQTSGQVTEFGAQLLKDPQRWLWAAVGSLILGLLGLPILQPGLVLVGGILSVSSFKKYRSTKKHNHQLTARFKAQS